MVFLVQGLLNPKTSTKRKDRSKAAFQIIIPGLEVPQWLTPQRFGYSICIELPSDWCNSRWMGFVLCAFFRYNCSGYSSERYSLKGHVTALGDMPCHAIEVPFFEAVIGETSFDYSVGHLWLLYWSRDDLLGTHWNDRECSRLKVVFDSNSPSVEVIKCAARLICEQDVEELNQTIAQTQDPPNSDEENALEERLSHGRVHVNLNISTQDPVMAILDTDITARLGKCPSDSFDKCKGKPKLIKNSQMNDALQSMDEANKVRIEANKTKAERNKRNTIDEVSSNAPTNDFSLRKCINILEAMEEVNDEIFMKAVKKFKQDPGDREIFVSMSLARKKVWLGSL